MQSAGVLGSLEAAAPPAHRHLDEPEPLEAMDRWDYGEIYYDEIANLPLPSDKVKEARAEELEYMTSKLPAWARGYTPEHVRQRGLTPVPTRFLDVNKGGWIPETMSIWSRLVVQETRRRSSIAADDIASVFSATPPIRGSSLCVVSMHEHQAGLLGERS